MSTATDAVGVSTEIVRSRFPDATAAFLAGSAARGSATPTSDLDIVVILDNSHFPFRETVRLEGIPVELFVHTEESLEYWYEREQHAWRNTLADMVATGIPLLRLDEEGKLQSAATDVIHRGPPRLSESEREDRRYALTDALDDLVGADSPDERDAVAGQVMVWSAELSLVIRGQWLGRGKWLVRRLQEMDADLATHLAAAHRRCILEGNPDELVAVAESILDAAGGRLTEGYRRE